MGVHSKRVVLLTARRLAIPFLAERCGEAASSRRGHAITVCSSALSCTGGRRHRQQINILARKHHHHDLNLNHKHPLDAVQHSPHSRPKIQHGDHRRNQEHCKLPHPKVSCKSLPALQQYNLQLQKVLDKLQKDPLSITTEDARRLSENYEASDERSAKIISAVESLAVAAQEIHEETPSLGQGPQTSLLTVVNDLKVAVDSNPAEVTSEILKTTQTIVSSKFRQIPQSSP